MSSTIPESPPPPTRPIPHLRGPPPIRISRPASDIDPIVGTSFDDIDGSCKCRGRQERSVSVGGVTLSPGYESYTKRLLLPLPTEYDHNSYDDLSADEAYEIPPRTRAQKKEDISTGSQVSRKI
ncbi:unnamed protein product [Meganyctiphanes norvegica]|uniref:Uncharacterized protein n=1 Tax=Meganyctiphanes norvegica TaxID=48144 RepID=A0AAV2PKW7_MEGNR